MSAPIAPPAVVPARAALAGNPSDGYGGAVVAVPLPHFAARAVYEPAVRRHGTGPGEELVEAARAAYADHAGLHELPPGRVRWSTEVPLRVGLAGSSAIVIAVLRALDAALGDGALDGGELAELALRVETERLGFSAGLQDRLVQAHALPLHMDFAAGAVTALDVAVPALLVAWAPGAGEDSSAVHGDLRARHAAGDRGLSRAVDALREQADAARDALRTGDLDRLGTAMRASVAERCALYAPDPRHLALTELADRHGIATNFAGSGGAVVGLVPPEDPERLDALVAAYVAAGAAVIR